MATNDMPPHYLTQPESEKDVEVGDDLQDEKMADSMQKVVTSSSTKEFVPPDGGLKAWLCVLGGFSCLFVSFGFLNACGIFQLYYEEQLLRNKNSSDITWITTIALFLMYFTGPGLGVLADKKGPRVVLIPSGFLIIFAICMLSLSTQYYQVVLAEGVAYGLGAGGMFLTPMLCVGKWFSKKRGLATGIVVSGSGLGGVIFPIFVPRMIDQHGFAAAVRWTALIMGVMVVIAVLCVSSPYAAQAKNAPPSSDSFFAAYKQPSWILFHVGAFLFFWGFFAPFDYIPLFAAVRGGASQDMSNNIAAIVNAFSIVGRILPGFLADKFGQFNIMSGVALLSGILTLVFWLPLQFHPSEAGTIVFGGFFGFVSGGFISLMSPCIIQLCKGKLGDLGKRLGFFMLVISFAALSGLPIQGAIKDNASATDFAGLIGFSGAVMTIGGLLITASGVSLAREKAKA